MHSVALAAALAFRVIAVAELAAGTAALVAAAASLPLAGRLHWAASIPPRAAAIGGGTLPLHLDDRIPC